MTWEKAARMAMLIVYVLAGMGLARAYDDCRVQTIQIRNRK